LKDALRKSSPVILEPVMSVDVQMQEEKLGDVMGDLASRRGAIRGVDDVSGGKVIRADVPLAEMFGYSTAVRSLTQGRATYTMEFKHYAEVPKSVTEAIINKK
jgi:elongation factor G